LLLLFRSLLRCPLHRPVTRGRATPVPGPTRPAPDPAPGKRRLLVRLSPLQLPQAVRHRLRPDGAAMLPPVDPASMRSIPAGFFQDVTSFRAPRARGIPGHGRILGNLQSRQFHHAHVGLLVSCKGEKGLMGIDRKAIGSSSCLVLAVGSGWLLALVAPPV